MSNCFCNEFAFLAGLGEDGALEYAHGCYNLDSGTVLASDFLILMKKLEKQMQVDANHRSVRFVIARFATETTEVESSSFCSAPSAFVTF